MTIGELHVEALSPENRVLNYKIDLLAPFPKRESQWVKETGGWIHKKKKQRRILGTREVRQSKICGFAPQEHQDQDAF